MQRPPGSTEALKNRSRFLGTELRRKECPARGWGRFECREMTLDSTLTAQGLFLFSQMNHINNFAL